ncbi:hypothetical protein GCM10009850_114320 [Nonomuraea monospora]|uniref:Uncharacterized protein n=1 Tax=Nonomuraea monospora TaxID=568818 RepID=A0ABN3D2B4_9ACTN
MRGEWLWITSSEWLGQRVTGLPGAEGGGPGAGLPEAGLPEAGLPEGSAGGGLGRRRAGSMRAPGDTPILASAGNGQVAAELAGRPGRRGGEERGRRERGRPGGEQTRRG